MTTVLPAEVTPGRLFLPINEVSGRSTATQDCPVWRQSRNEFAVQLHPYGLPVTLRIRKKTHTYDAKSRHFLRYNTRMLSQPEDGCQARRAGWGAARHEMINSPECRQVGEIPGSRRRCLLPLKIAGIGMGRLPAPQWPPSHHRFGHIEMAATRPPQVENLPHQGAGAQKLMGTPLRARRGNVRRWLTVWICLALYVKKGPRNSGAPEAGAAKPTRTMRIRKTSGPRST